MIKADDFCRQWIIYEPGQELVFPAECQFEIKELGNGNYEFLPVSVTCPLTRALMTVVADETVPVDDRFKHGKGLDTVLRYGGTVPGFEHVYFTLNKIGKRRFIISIHPDDGKDHVANGGEDDIRVRMHGGPHGVDD